MLELEQEESLLCSSSYELPPNLAALLQRAWEQQQYQQYDQTPPTNGMDSKMLMIMVSGRRKTLLLSYKTLCSVLQVMMNQNECDSYNIMPLMLMMINMGNNNQYNMMLALMMSMMNKVKIS